MNFTVSLEWDAEEGVLNVSVPSLPGCYSWGETKKRALLNIKDAILAYLEVAARYGDPIHTETEMV